MFYKIEWEIVFELDKAIYTTTFKSLVIYDARLIQFWRNLDEHILYLGHGFKMPRLILIIHYKLLGYTHIEKNPFEIFRPQLLRIIKDLVIMNIFFSFWILYLEKFFWTWLSMWNKSNSFAKLVFFSTSCKEQNELSFIMDYHGSLNIRNTDFSTCTKIRIQRFKKI